MWMVGLGANLTGVFLKIGYMIFFITPCKVTAKTTGV
jgi:hypothetical protein